MFLVFKALVCSVELGSEIKTIDSPFDSGRMKKISGDIGEAFWEFLIFSKEAGRG